MDESLPLPDGESLVAWRLGRLEKAVDQINTHSIARDEKIIEKLEQIGEVSQKVSQNTWRIQSLESSRSSIYKFLTGIASAVTLIILEMIFNLI